MVGGKRIFTSISICMLFFLISACNYRQKHIERTVNDLYAQKIVVPYSDMETIVVDSSKLKKSSSFRILAYVDSTECTSCYASHFSEWEYILKECRKYEPAISFITIIEAKELANEIKREYLKSNFSKSIFIDRTGVFRKKNPTFPDANIMHVLLLDKDNKVVLVGNPLNNKRIEELLYNKLKESIQ